MRNPPIVRRLRMAAARTSRHHRRPHLDLLRLQPAPRQRSRLRPRPQQSWNRDTVHMRSVCRAAPHQVHPALQDEHSGVRGQPRRGNPLTQSPERQRHTRMMALSVRSSVAPCGHGVFPHLGQWLTRKPTCVQNTRTRPRLAPPTTAAAHRTLGDEMQKHACKYASKEPSFFFPARHRARLHSRLKLPLV